ncbi:hypothetical protein ACFWZT_10200 [Streptomyces alboflavus]|uniref:hypothetical protein n=1 Tax=Streptomyces alboflavus TaxID=67267 RepID=UPI00367BCA0E
MGKASRKRQEQRARRTTLAASTEVNSVGDPRTLGEEALARLFRSNAPERLSLAGAYAFGYGELRYKQQEGTDPDWYQELDPLDALFLGTAWPRTFSCAFEFANARDAWLRVLRGTVHEKGVQCFVREAVTASEQLGLPVDDGKLMLALTGRLEAAGLDQRRLPRKLLPAVSLQGCRAVFGPSLDLRLPAPPKDTKERLKQFWKAMEKEPYANDTPRAILRDGLRRFREADLPVKTECGTLLPALYSALMAKPGEFLENMGEHAWAWALSLDEASTLVPVLDILLIAPELQLSVTDTLGRLFAVPAFTEPIPSAAMIWTSSPGLALPRLAFGLGMSEVSTRRKALTPDLLDWAGMHARMRLTATARALDADLEEAGSADSTDATPDESDEESAKRRDAVRKAVLRKVRKKPGVAADTNHRSDRPVERIWNADGSSVIRFATDSPHGQIFKEGMEAQQALFRQKFGRDPGPDDPLFFDPDADEPTPITKQLFDDVLLDMAERAEEVGIDPAFLLAWREVGYVVTEENRSMFTTAEVLAFTRAVTRHRQATG